ncbi:MAG: TerB N-terminal domain-containing protein [Saccharofermentanales bacterium]
MSETKHYEPYKIPARDSITENGYSFVSSSIRTGLTLSFDDQTFAEIDMGGAADIAYAPAPVPPPVQPVMDDKRRIYMSMREIARYDHSSYFLNLKIYDKQAQYENSKIFYKQAVLMKDFEDDYAEAVSFSSYFPYYQLMNYEQFRTYFTWRTKVRNGHIGRTSLSYAFVYIYELLNNIGVDGPVDGLEKLMSFWSEFKVFDAAIEKYLIKWIKDYHICYELPHSFREFLCINGMQDHYPHIVGYEPAMHYSFDYLSGISKYNIRQSVFYNDATSQMIAGCFDFVISRLRDMLVAEGIEFNQLIFQSSRSSPVWTPFSGALFYPASKQPDRRVVLSENEVYVCSQSKWLHSTVITADSGRSLIGYILKQMEVVLRQAAGFRFKLSANLNTVHVEILQRLSTAGIFLERAVTDAVLEFYREQNRTVVSVDKTILDKIRLEALDTLDKLIVPENEFRMVPADAAEVPTSDEEKEEPILPSADALPMPDGWTNLRYALDEAEIKTLAAVLQGDCDIRRFADEYGIMLEVLADGINQKAVDHIGDSILELDGSMMVYDEYRDKIMMMVG